MKGFRNMKIGVKITLGFLIVALIAGAVGAVGIIALNRVGGSYALAFEDTVIALDSMEQASPNFQELRADLFEIGAGLLHAPGAQRTGIRPPGRAGAGGAAGPRPDDGRCAVAFFAAPGK